MIETRAIEVVDGSLSASSAGTRDRPAVVMVHGGLTHSQMWSPLLSALRDDIFGIAYDCRCFGRSTTMVDGTYSDIDDLARVFQAFDVDAAFLMGESRGARIALDFALACPDKVRGLFLLSPDISGFDAPVTPEEKELFEAIEAADEASAIEDLIACESRLWIDGPTRGAAEEREHLRTRVAEMSRVNYAQQGDPPDFTALEPPAAGRLTEIVCPVRVLVGDADTVGTRTMAAAIACTCPQATLSTIANAAHLLTLERPGDIESELRSWLRHHC